MKAPWLENMGLFAEVAKTKSFVKAAANLKMPVSTLSRRMSLFEQSLGFRLLQRTTRQVTLTLEGASYLERINHIVEEANLIHDELKERTFKPKGHIRISMLASFAELHAAKILAELSACYPELTFEIDASPLNVNLIMDSFDVAFRAGDLLDSNLHARLLTHLRGALYASPEYLMKHPAIQHPEDLKSHQCLRLGGKIGQNWQLVKGHEKYKIPTQGKFQFNHSMIGLKLALNHAGIALIMEGACPAEIESGQLVRVLPDWQCPGVPLYALTATRHIPARIRLLIDFFAERLFQ